MKTNWVGARLHPNDGRELHDWEMTHHLAAAGEGYAWPDLTFASNGESIQDGLKPARATPGQFAISKDWMPGSRQTSTKQEWTSLLIKRWKDSTTAKNTHIFMNFGKPCAKKEKHQPCPCSPAS
jgi:hypothetical protein